MRDARGDAPQRRQTFAHLKLRIDAFQRVQVTQRHQRSHAFAIFLDGLHADAYTLRPFAREQLRLGRHFSQLIAFNVQGIVKRMTGRKDFRHAPPQKVSRGSAQEFFRRRADHHGARIPREQQQAVLKPSHHRIHIFAHGAEDFMHAAQLLPDLRNLPAHQSEFVPASS